MNRTLKLQLLAPMAALALALTACPSQKTETPAASANDGAPGGSAAPAPTRPPTETGGTAPVAIRNVLPGLFEITNDTDAPKQVALDATIERRGTDGNFAEEKGLDNGKGYRLVEDCAAAAPPACVTIAPHATLRPVAFKGLSCSAQCNATCRANSWLGPGAFRLTLKTCGADAAAAAPFSGPTFELPDARSDKAFERWALGQDALRTIAMKLDDPPPSWKGDEPPATGKIAGFAVKGGSERALTPAQLRVFVGLLQDPKGFDDETAKRCAMKDLVGFRLARLPQTTGGAREDVVEIAIDRTCDAFFAARGGDNGTKRTLHASHYDPSSAAFQALLKELKL